MASSGSFSGSICSGHYALRIDWSQAQNVSANTSTITAKIYLVNDWNLDIGARTANHITIGSTKQSFNSPAITTKGTHLLNTVTQTVTHDSDGSKSISISAYHDFQATISGTYYSSITASANITLDTIPRASSISMAAGTMGSASTITITRASSSFTHTLTYTFGSATGTIATKTTSTSVSWTPGLTLANQIPNATSGTATIKCTTYNGSTAIGSKSINVTLKVPDTVVPTISSLTAARVDGVVPSDWGIYVQTKSKAKLTISGAAGAYGSTINSYSITGGGFSGTSSTLTTGFLNTSGSITFTAKVTDSRGRTSSAKTVSISVVAYSTPSFSSYLSQRCNSSGTVTKDGTYAKGLVKFTYASCSSKNTITTATYYRKNGTTSWTNANKTLSSNTAFTFGGGNLTTESSYEIKYTLTDAFTTVSIIDTISTAAVVMDFKSGGKGVAVGKVSETDNTFEVSEDWDVKVHGMTLANYIKQSALASAVPISKGGTGATTAANARTNLGVLPLSGGTLTGQVKSTYPNTDAFLATHGTANKDCGFKATRSDTSVTVFFGVGSGGVNHGIYSNKLGKWLIYGTDSAVVCNGTATNVTGTVAVGHGGTGATTAAAARTNLGIKATSLYNGTLTTGSTTFSLSYKCFIIIGQPTSSSSRVALTIPASLITTSAVNYQFADETNYYSFKLSYSGATVTLAYSSRSSSGQILRIFGIN